SAIGPSTRKSFRDSEKPPAFFVFVEKALLTATDVIGSSDIPDVQKRRALQSLRYVSEDALIRIIERKRGRIRDYRESAYGLVEDPGGRQPRPRRGRPYDLNCPPIISEDSSVGNANPPKIRILRPNP